MAFVNANAGICDSVRLALVELYSTSDAGGSSGVEPRKVAPGETFMVTGECIGGEDEDVRVVLSLSDGDATSGFHEMLATDQQRDDGSLRVRVPNMKETRNHTFRVKLFLGDSDPRVCDAGSIRVV